VEKEFYSEYFIVEDKHWWFIGRRRLLLRVLNRFVGKSKGRPKILDIGCGTGTMLRYLSRYGDAQGADADEEAVRFCRLRSAGNITQLTGASLPFPDSSFEVVTMLDVLEHIDDDVAALEEVWRILRSGGTFIVTVPAYQFLWGAQDVISHHKRRYRAAQLKSRLEASNLDIKKISYFNFLLFPFIAAIRLLRRPALNARGMRELKSDFTMTKPGRLNQILSFLFSVESLLINRINFPFGVSILAVAEKPLGSSSIVSVQKGAE
jgi:SAM-dependent methyltransferase